MIRVVLRHVDNRDGRLLGDFAPSEVRALLELLDSTPIYVEDDLCVLNSVPTQLVGTDDFGAPRFVLEVLL